MKNWEPFVSRPALAMERRPGRVCLSEGGSEGGKEGEKIFSFVLHMSSPSFQISISISNPPSLSLSRPPSCTAKQTRKNAKKTHLQSEIFISELGAVKIEGKGKEREGYVRGC